MKEIKRLFWLIGILQLMVLLVLTRVNCSSESEETIRRARSIMTMTKWLLGESTHPPVNVHNNIMVTLSDSREKLQAQVQENPLVTVQDEYKQENPPLSRQDVPQYSPPPTQLPAPSLPQPSNRPEGTLTYAPPPPIPSSSSSSRQPPTGPIEGYTKFNNKFNLGPLHQLVHNFQHNLNHMNAKVAQRFQTQRRNPPPPIPPPSVSYVPAPAPAPAPASASATDKRQRPDFVSAAQTPPIQSYFMPMPIQMGRPNPYRVPPVNMNEMVDKVTGYWKQFIPNVKFSLEHKQPRPYGPPPPTHFDKTKVVNQAYPRQF